MTSLGVSPSLNSRARPSAPGRSKRNSLTPTLRTNIAPGPPSPRRQAGSGDKPIQGGAGLMGGLRERSESEVKRAGREELVLALKSEWEARDRLTPQVNEHVDALESERRKLEKEREELVHTLGGLQARVDEAFNEQSRLEMDIEGRDELLEKMRGRISEGEKSLRDGQKRYAEQERSFEAEREAFRAQELHLRTRIKTLSSTTTSTGKPVSPTTNESMELLQEELASLSASHCTLIAQLNTVSSELGDIKQRNKVLEEENAGWELLMRERTLNGGMRGKGLLGEEWLDEGEGEGHGMSDDEDIRRGKSGLEALDEEMEGFMESELSASPIEEKGRLGARKRTGENLGDLPVSGSGLDLAAELGRAEVLDGGEMRVLGKGDEGEALRAEVKHLREANKALTLYSSKIIDRIISQEGFEHILAVDYKTRRLNTQRARLGQGGGRTSVHDIVRNMQAGEVPPPAPSMPSALSTHVVDAGHVVTVKKPRPMSMMARAFSSGSASVVEDSGNAPAPLATVPTPVSSVQSMKDEEAKAAKKSKRGFSIDFRSFGFGSAPPPAPSPPAEPKGLKPLQLPRRTVSTTSRPPSMRIPSPPILCPIDNHGVPVARKLDPEVEDEEDRRERHRMEAAMRLMGIDRSSLSPSGTIAEEAEPDMSQAAMTHGRSSTGSTSSHSSISRTTPLSRLSNHLASSFSPTLELIDPMSPVTDDAASAAIAVFNKKEQEQAKQIGKGTYQAGFTCPTSPSAGSMRDRRASMRRGSAQSSDGAVRAMAKGRISKSESISTLWSAGSGSRRGSVEVLAGAPDIVREGA